MSSTAIQTALPAPIESKLRSLRRGVKAWLWIDGAGRLLASALALILLDLAIDWYFRMDWAQRAVSLGLMIAALLAVAYRRLLRPLLASVTDDALCLRVEDRHDTLGQSLISAV